MYQCVFDLNTKRRKTMAVYYNRLNQRRNRYSTTGNGAINTDHDTLVPSTAQPRTSPNLQSGLTLNHTAGASGATPAEQGLHTAGG